MCVLNVVEGEVLRTYLGYKEALRHGSQSKLSSVWFSAVLVFLLDTLGQQSAYDPHFGLSVFAYI